MGKLRKWRLTRLLVDDRMEGNAGDEMRPRSSSRNPEPLGPPRNPLGRLERLNVSNMVESRRCVSAGNGFSIILTTVSSCNFLSRLIVTLHTRSECSNAVRRLPSWVGFRLPRPSILMAIEIRGQVSKSFLAGVFGVQRSCRLRRRCDVNMSCRHLRHTCTSPCHQL